MSRASAEKRAYHVLAESNLVAPPFDPRQLAELYGAEVIEAPADPGESGFCLRDGQRAIIGVNSHHHVNRKRFTIAHELGHLLLHGGRELTVDKAVRISYRNEISSMATDLQEIEANSFAAALLMPAGILREESDPLVNSGTGEDAMIEKLAELFLVSPQAMNYRLVNLGILLG